jgi:methyl acetate hydrolase
MHAEFAAAAEAILCRATAEEPSVPGAVAMATDRSGIFYKGAAGVRRLGDAVLRGPEAQAAHLVDLKARSGRKRSFVKLLA